VKQVDDAEKNLTRLLARLGKPQIPDLENDGDPIAALVLSFLMWESTTARALAAFKRIRDAVVDFNELRVNLPYETMELLGERFPGGLERCQRLRAVLNDLFNREHAVSLQRPAEVGKRELKRYLDSLEGMVPYVSTRVGLLCFDIHGIPVDESLRRGLIVEQIADSTTDAVELSNWLTRQIAAEEAAKAHWSLQLWSDRLNSSGESTRSQARRGGGGKKTPAEQRRRVKGGARSAKTAGRAAKAS
jgi:hypothetical protein